MTDTTTTGSDTCDPHPTQRPLLGYLYRTAYVVPSRTGGGDHGFAATRSGRSPMVFGGRRFEHDGLCDPRRRLIFRRIVQLGRWATRRDWEYLANRVDTRGAEVCMGMVTA